MGDVYKNAYCTLAASASSNSSEGLFHQRSFEDGLKPVSLDLELPSQNGINLTKVFIRPPILNPREEVTRAILTTRAWTMQERALSRRIVHFTRTRLLWECRTCTLDDTNPEDEREYASVMPLTWYQDGETIRHSFDTSTVSEYCANLWRTLMQYFSGRDITYEKDTFPAVSGLAKTLQPFIGGRYLAGIWENDVLNGLAWKLSDEYDFRNPGAPEPNYEGSYSPSWSWAAKGPVKFEMWEDRRASERRNSKEAAKEDRTMTYVDAKIDLSGKDDTGTISFASLTLRGRLKQVPYLNSSNLGRCSHFMLCDLAVEGAKSKETERVRSIRVKWDFVAEPIERHSSSSGGQESSETEESDTDSTDSSGPASHIYLFELRRRLTVDDKPSSYSYRCNSIGLVIEELAEHRHQGDKERRFTRLGFCEWEDKLNYGEHDCFVGIEDTNITLV